jgi:twitching motility two-component system response regulator PilH
MDRSTHESRLSSAPMGSPSSRPTVLIVDDDRGVLQLFEQMLRLEGYSVIAVDNAEDGLREARRHRPNAILLDLRMPRVDGLQFLRRLRQDDKGRRTPVAIVTGDYFYDAAMSTHLHDLGAEVRFKPVWVEDLVALVRRLLGVPEPAVHH